ncbi:MarR family winged helix-turn-helix transcriptional regulator [Clostridium scatologenes]|uniref:Transcriptional regulator, MarR family n=1 Tax=Clostridium scatologenes TaxID=1548 RepID=A0A0E3JYU2_CLOSL|nr:MarR family transcriptional regulator [Clostridium scatologenes]AKA67695.1 transcriptional regulator, MarR family [Clostridium scatologenes]
MNDSKVEADHLFRKKVLDTLDNQSSINIQMNFWFNEMMTYHGVSYSEYRIIRLLRKYQNGIEPSVIADKLAILRQTTTNMVDGLQKKYLVERSPHPVDRRRIYIKLTPEGVELANKLVEEMSSVQSRVLSHFTSEDMEKYLDIRTKIIKYTEDEIKKRYTEES